MLAWLTLTTELLLKYMKMHSEKYKIGEVEGVWILCSPWKLKESMVAFAIVSSSW